MEICKYNTRKETELQLIMKTLVKIKDGQDLEKIFLKQNLKVQIKIIIKKSLLTMKKTFFIDVHCLFNSYFFLLIRVLISSDVFQDVM